MKILLADKQDITRAGLIYVIEKMEGLETKYVEDKTELMLALRENEDTVVILDYTLFDINDAAELLILNQRFPYTRWLLFSEDLSADFVTCAHRQQQYVQRAPEGEFADGNQGGDTLLRR